MENTKGGIRKNAGRKKLTYPVCTLALRVPVSQKEEVRVIVKDWLKKNPPVKI